MWTTFERYVSDVWVIQCVSDTWKDRRKARSQLAQSVQRSVSLGSRLAEWIAEGSVEDWSRLQSPPKRVSRPEPVSRLAAVHYRANGPRPVVEMPSYVSAGLFDDV